MFDVCSLQYYIYLSLSQLHMRVSFWSTIYIFLFLLKRSYLSLYTFIYVYFYILFYSVFSLPFLFRYYFVVWFLYQGCIMFNCSLLLFFFLSFTLLKTEVCWPNFYQNQQALLNRIIQCSNISSVLPQPNQHRTLVCIQQLWFSFLFSNSFFFAVTFFFFLFTSQ